MYFDGIAGTVRADGRRNAGQRIGFDERAQHVRSLVGEQRHPAVLHARRAEFSTVAFDGNVVREQEVGGERKPTLQTAYTFYGSDFGVIEMVPDRCMAGGIDNNVYGIDPDYWAVATLRGFETEQLAKTGDNVSYQMVTELTLEARNEASSFAIRDLNATAP